MPESLKKPSFVIEVKGREGGLSIVEGPQNKLVGRGFDEKLLADLNDSKDDRESGTKKHMRGYVQFYQHT